MTSNWLNYESRRSLLGNGVFQHVPDTASRLRDSGIEVLMIGSSPIFPSEVPLLALAKGGPAKDDVFHALQQNVRRALPQPANGRYSICRVIRFFVIASELCRFRDDEAYLLYDNGHMTREGADRVVDQLSHVVFGNRTSN